MDFPSVCALSESSLTNLIGSGLNLLCKYKAIQNRNVGGPGQRSRFLVLTKRRVASGDQDVLKFDKILVSHQSERTQGPIYVMSNINQSI